MKRQLAIPRRPGFHAGGQALAEFALVAPLFFVLLLAIIEGGRFIYHYEMLNSATREGARYAIIHGANALCADGGPTGPMPPSAPVSACPDPTGDDVRAAVRDAMFALIGIGQMTIPDPTYQPNNNARGSNVTVSVTYTYPPLVAVFPSITLSAESTLVINN